MQLLDQLPLPARSELEAALVVVRRAVGAAHGVVDVGAGVLAVAPGTPSLPLDPGDANAAEGAHTVITAAAWF